MISSDLKNIQSKINDFTMHAWTCEYMCGLRVIRKFDLLACIGGMALVRPRAKALAWSWSWHLWPTVVEWHRWDYYLWIVLCLEMGVGVGDTLKALVNWEPHESPHEGTQANTKVGNWFWNKWQRKSLGGSDQGLGQGSWEEMFLAIPKRILEIETTKFMKYKSLSMYHLTYD